MEHQPRCLDTVSVLEKTEIRQDINFYLFFLMMVYPPAPFSILLLLTHHHHLLLTSLKFCLAHRHCPFLAQNWEKGGGWVGEGAQGPVPSSGAPSVVSAKHSTRVVGPRDKETQEAIP